MKNYNWLISQSRNTFYVSMLKALTTWMLQSISRKRVWLISVVWQNPEYMRRDSH